ncbi:hypothetical protein BD779DRAFT_1682308 [Infundibulicybe gibba]|nr:hypothetical protein BD779DRAFT_1682308 [Infundibulicybe gibba]
MAPQTVHLSPPPHNTGQFFKRGERWLLIPQRPGSKPAPTHNTRRRPSEEVTSTDNPGGSTAASKRCRVTVGDPVFGFVSGAKRGNSNGILQGYSTSTTDVRFGDSVKRFTREVASIVSRCERISEETGCWLVLMARHATGPPVIHFSSSRLRRDAKPDAADLVNRFSNLTSALLVAKRDEALNSPRN